MGRAKGTWAKPRWRRVLPAHDVDRLHREACQHHTSCARCNFAERKTLWQPRFLIDRMDPSRGSWVKVGIDSMTKQAGLGCVVCEHAKMEGSKWAHCGITDGHVRTSQLTQHSRCRAHKAAVAKFIDTAADNELFSGVQPPSAEQLRQTLAAVRSGRKHGATGIPGIGKGGKVRRMVACLAEGHRMVHRKFLRSAGTISLHQDGRKGRLVIRYRACNENLEVKSGTLGQVSLAKEFGELGAVAIAQGTMKMISNFCTPRASMPRIRQHTRNRKAKPDTALVTHFKRKVELMDTDAAADEQKAHKLLRGEDDGDTAVPGDLPNCKIHNLDKAHSARRTAGCSRPAHGSQSV